MPYAATIIENTAPLIDPLVFFAAGQTSMGCIYYSWWEVIPLLLSLLLFLGV